MALSNDCIGPLTREEAARVSATPVILDDDLCTALSGVSPAFLPLAARMPPLSRRLLLLGEDPRAVSPDGLLDELELPPHLRAAAARGLHHEHSILTVPDALPPDACARLRAAVDADCNQGSDTVDGGPDHQLNCTREQLTDLLGADAAKKLWTLPSAFAALHKDVDIGIDDVASEALDDRYLQIFIRRYSAETRPWNPFHTDGSALTINVALEDDSNFSGGGLVACTAGEIRFLTRRRGEATVHSSTLLHAVALMKGGVRYSLIVFIGLSQARPAELSFGQMTDGAHPTLRTGTLGSLGAVGASREEEAAALHTLMKDAEFMELCVVVLGPERVAGMQKTYGGLCGDDGSYGGQHQGLGSPGKEIEQAVLGCAAPHLRPLSILSRSKLCMNEEDGTKSRSLCCWSMLALMTTISQNASRLTARE